MGLKKNVLYSSLLTLSTYLVPLIVFPYISRVLGADGLGIIDNVDYTIDYCILLSMLGMNLLGIREIAKNRANPSKLQMVFSNLFTLNIVTTFIVLCVLSVLVFTIPQWHERWQVFCLGASKIVFNLFWIEWFFKGIENFKYITLRTIFIRLAFVISVFIFVRTKEDYLKYYILWLSITAGNAISNWTYRRRFVRLSFKNLELGNYLKPFVMLGLVAICSAVYTKLNVTILGFFADDSQVGYYTAAMRLYQVLIAMFSSITGVMLPRMSSLLANNDMDSVKNLTDKVFGFLFLFAIPIVVYLEFFAPEFFLLFTGSGYEGAVLPLRIVIFQLLIIGTEQIFILQLLIPGGYDMKALLCTITGASICILCNLLFTKELGAVGSSIAWIAAESAVMLIACGYVKKYFDIAFPFKTLLLFIVYSIPYAIFAAAILILSENMWIRLGVSAVLFAVWAVILEEKIFKINLFADFGALLGKRKR